MRDMRKRRVGVTARSRLIVGNQATGTPHIASEIAAPLVSRTPMGTVATATSECGWKRGDTTGVKDNRAESSSGEMRISKESRIKRRRTSALKARMRRCLILRQGDKPPETPGPLSLGLDCTEGRKAVKGSLRRGPPLTAFLPSEEAHPAMRERGPSERARTRWSAAKHVKACGALRAHEALPHAPSGGHSPPETPQKSGAYT
jgi:hypothetical protein